MNKHIKFYIFNLVLITLLTALLFLFSKGSGSRYPLESFGISLLITIPIIYFQYPILLLRKNWAYKSLIFYLSMILFLWIFGVITGWNQKVGNSDPGTWIARLDAGIRMILYGQVFGGFLSFIIITLLNYTWKEKLFEKH